MNGDVEEAIGSLDTLDIHVIIHIFPNLTFSGNMVTCLQCEPVAYGKVAINITLTYTVVFKIDNR